MLKCYIFLNPSQLAFIGMIPEQYLIHILIRLMLLILVIFSCLMYNNVLTDYLIIMHFFMSCRMQHYYRSLFLSRLHIFYVYSYKYAKKEDNDEEILQIRQLDLE